MKYKSLLIRIPPDIHDALTRLRTERHVNTSAWVRATLKNALESEGLLLDTASASNRLGCPAAPGCPAPRLAAPPPRQRGLGLHLPRRYFRPALGARRCTHHRAVEKRPGLEHHRNGGPGTQQRAGYRYRLRAAGTLSQTRNEDPEILVRQAEEQGHAHAQYRLGGMYANAQFLLGFMYVTGNGVAQDYVQAHKWINLAASRTTGEAQDRRSGRGELAKKMTASQVAEAQRLATKDLGATEGRVRSCRVSFVGVMRGFRLDPGAFPFLVARIVPRGFRLGLGNRVIFHYPELIRQLPRQFHRFTGRDSPSQIHPRFR